MVSFKTKVEGHALIELEQGSLEVYKHEEEYYTYVINIADTEYYSDEDGFTTFDMAMGRAVKQLLEIACHFHGIIESQPTVPNPHLASG